MHLGHYLTLLGAATSILGMILEAVAIVGIASYRVRRMLPVSSPITLQALGCTCFCGGLFCLFLGHWLR
jgi:hypothetical protein